MRFNTTAYSTDEDAGTVQLTLIFSNPSSFVETAQVINSDVTAKGTQNSETVLTFCMFMCCNTVGGGIDYSSGPYNVTFPAGSTYASFNIVINVDNIFEGDETFTVYIAPFANESIVSAPDIAVVTILDTTGKDILNAYCVRPHWIQNYSIYRVSTKAIQTYID